MTAFPITVTPELLVHLAQGAATCTDPVSVELVTGAIRQHVGHLPEGCVFAIAAVCIYRRHRATGLVATAADQAWADVEQDCQRALGLDTLDGAQ